MKDIGKFFKRHNPFGRKQRKEEGQRDSLSQLREAREGLYSRLMDCERLEKNWLQEGKESSVQSRKLRLSAQLVQKRKEIGRLNSQISAMDHRINILEAHFSNKDIIAQNKVATMPTTEELTDHAVEAEQILEILSCDAQLSSSLTDALDISPEEAQVILEFEEKLADREEQAVMVEFNEPSPSEVDNAVDTQQRWLDKDKQASA